MWVGQKVVNARAVDVVVDALAGAVVPDHDDVEDEEGVIQSKKRDSDDG